MSKTPPDTDADYLAKLRSKLPSMSIDERLRLPREARKALAKELAALPPDILF
jgi:hypothetical protein